MDRNQHRRRFTSAWMANLLQFQPMRAWLSIGVMILSLSVSLPVWAQDEDTIALIDLEISGDGPPELRQKLQESISNALTSAGLNVTDLPTTLKALQSVPELIGCSSTPCLERIYELVPAHRFVRALVKASGATYELRLELLSALEDESVLNTVVDTCEVCTIADLHEMAAGAAQKLLNPEAGQLVPVQLATDPPGALILIDGEEVGTSPVDTKLTLGSHDVQATLDGHTSSEKSIEVIADDSEKQRFELMLSKLNVTAKPVGTGKVDYGLKKWAVLGGSGALLTVGTILVVIDGNSTGGGTRDEVRATLLPGILSISGGALLGALGGWMLWKESQSKSSQSSISVQATRGGGIAGYSSTF